MTDRHPNLRQFDLNLVHALAALLEQGSVTGAAQRLGLTQPALSRMLGRLRVMFEDPLLVKVGRRMVPTPRAEALRLPLQRLLGEMGDLIRPAAFDPAAARGTVRIAATDAVTESVVTPWLGAMAEELAGMSFEVIAVAADTPAALARGEVDFAVDVYPDPLEGCRTHHLLFDRFVCVLRQGHPLARRRLAPSDYVRLRHIQVTGTGGGGTMLEQELARLGISRRIALRVPSLTAAPFVAAHSDWALTVPGMRARLAALRVPIAIVPLPFAIRAIPLSLLWHERTEASPLHTWMRRRLLALPLAAPARAGAGARASLSAGAQRNRG